MKAKVMTGSMFDAGSWMIISGWVGGLLLWSGRFKGPRFSATGLVKYRWSFGARTCIFLSAREDFFFLIRRLHVKKHPGTL